MEYLRLPGKVTTIILVHLFMLFAGSLVICEAQETARVFSLYWENDVFAGTDRDYSNGLKLGWSSPYGQNQSAQKSLKDKMIERLPGVDDPQARRATFLAIGQNVYTPRDTDRSDLVVDDRPYAGFSYLSFGIHADTGLRRNLWEFDCGVIGPWSLAQNGQDLVHDAIGTRRSAGWEHQLANELALGVGFETKWMLWQHQLGDAFGLEVIPHLGARLGNVATYANAGAELRFGWFLPNNFGTCPIRPGCDVGNLNDANGNRSGLNRWGTHFFIAVDGRAVLRNIFLDGNTFQDSHSVGKEAFVFDLMSGVAIQFKSLQISYALIQRSREFQQQGRSHAFGALKFTYFF